MNYLKSYNDINWSLFINVIMIAYSVVSYCSLWNELNCICMYVCMYVFMNIIYLPPSSIYTSILIQIQEWTILGDTRRCIYEAFAALSCIILERMSSLLIFIYLYAICGNFGELPQSPLASHTCICEFSVRTTKCWCVE